MGPKFSNNLDTGLKKYSGGPAEAHGGQLCRRCEPNSLGFKSTDELPDLQNVIGQPRAFRALELGCEVAGPGYNIFILGMPGSGRTTLSLEYLQRRAAEENIPNDWCYVYNFEDPHSPKVIELPPGRGNELRKDIEKLVEIIEKDLPRAFESEEYTRTRDSLLNELKKNQETEFIRLQEYVENYKFTIVRTPFGIVLTPTVQGKPLTPDEIQNLTNEQREKLEELQLKLGEEVEKTLIHIQELGRLTSEKIDELNERTTLFVIDPIINLIKEKYLDLEKIRTYLNSIREDVVVYGVRFRSSETKDQSSAGGPKFSERYFVNVIVDNSKTNGSPVLLESQPTYSNLFGRIDHIVIMGVTHTDFKMIRAGALHRANGGYLVLPARDLLTSPYAWEGLKRVLHDGSIRIIELGNQLGLLSTETLDPEPIPLDIKIILVGTPLIYYLLRQYDDDFDKLFKVRAEFAIVMERKPETEREYGLFIKSVLVDNQLPPFDNTAVARIIEFSSRLVEDQSKLSTRFGKISDLIRESAYWSKKSQSDPPLLDIVTDKAVQRAIDENIYRNNLMEERVQELLTTDTIKMEVTGSVVGQINALSVFIFGDFAFGKPSRLTAAIFPGRAGIIDIERQSKLSGSIHTKGVLILSGFIGQRYGRFGPLNLSASLTFEQSYDEIDGDSASAAEVICLLSAIAHISIRQDIAITGSINQFGIIQAIGGVNEKIEGFYATCKSMELTGTQGVIIPYSNLRNLMLKTEVVQAVEANQFRIWPIKTIDEAIAILSGINPGEIEPDGNYSQGSFNLAVVKNLKEFARLSRAKMTEEVNHENTVEEDVTKSDCDK